MKPTIAKSGTYWKLLYYRPQAGTPGLVAHTEMFMFWEGAINRWAKLREMVKREQKSLKRLAEISLTLLSVREYQFLIHMDKSKCKNITRRQAGYLKGIWERQRS